MPKMFILIQNINVHIKKKKTVQERCTKKYSNIRSYYDLYKIDVIRSDHICAIVIEINTKVTKYV